MKDEVANGVSCSELPSAAGLRLYIRRSPAAEGSSVRSIEHVCASACLWVGLDGRNLMNRALLAERHPSF